MANITGGAAPGAQLQLMDAGADLSAPAADSLDKLLEKAKEEQGLEPPVVVAWLPPPPASTPEKVMPVLKKGDQETPLLVVHRQRTAGDEHVANVPEKKHTSLAAGERIAAAQQRQYVAAPPLQSLVPQLQHQHPIAPPQANELALMLTSAHKLQADDRRTDNTPDIPLVKPTHEVLIRQHMAPSAAPPAPRPVKQEFTSAAVLPVAKPEGDGQSRISYAFRSWGSEHRVELTSLRQDHQPLTVLLTPSDNLVNRRLQEAVVSQPLDVNLLLQDDGRGDQQRQQQHDDNAPEAEDEP